MPERAGEKTRRLILDAALDVIDAEGVDAVTHRRVGEEAGVSHGVVSYHFPKRDGLILTAFEYHLGAAEDYGTKIGFSAPQLMTQDQLIDLLTNLVAEELASPSSIRIDLELALYASRQPDLAKMFDTWINTGVDRLSRSLEQSGFAQPHRLAFALLSLARGFLLECLLNRSLTEQEFRQRVITLFTSMASEAPKPP